LAAEPEAITWAGIEVDTLFICLPDLSFGLSGGNETVVHRNGPAQAASVRSSQFERFSQRLTPLSPFGCTSDTHAGRDFLIMFKQLRHCERPATQE
jgi:hypothetical protein